MAVALMLPQSTVKAMLKAANHEVIAAVQRPAAEATTDQT